MLRVFFNLMDGFSIRHLVTRIVLTLAGAGAGLIGLGFLLSAVFQAIAAALGTLDASLICGTVFVIIGLALVGFGSLQWNRRPRPMLARARLGVAAELLGLAQTLIRREPSKAVIAALILGAVTEYSQKRARETGK